VEEHIIDGLVAGIGSDLVASNLIRVIPRGRDVAKICDRCVPDGLDQNLASFLQRCGYRYSDDLSMPRTPTDTKEKAQGEKKHETPEEAHSRPLDRPPGPVAVVQPVTVCAALNGWWGRVFCGGSGQGTKKVS
jgi:hypothetical protein